jgi:hypothetical protein
MSIVYTIFFFGSIASFFILRKFSLFTRIVISMILFLGLSTMFTMLLLFIGDKPNTGSVRISLDDLDEKGVLKESTNKPSKLYTK